MKEVGRTLILRPPRLRSLEDRQQERHASWLEVFFDLIFVAVIESLRALLSADLTVSGFFHFILLFIPIWWTWSEFTFYASRFDTDDIVYRFLMLIAMLPIAALAITMHEVFAKTSFLFPLSYIGVKSVLIVLYIRSWRHVPVARSLCMRYIVATGISCVLWLISIMVPPPVRYGLWMAGVLLELVMPLLSSRAIAVAPYDVDHIAERLALFTMIVLGESVLTVVSSITDTSWQGPSVLAAAAGFVIAASLWWIYFAFFATTALHGGWRFAGPIYVYGHLAIFIGLTVASVGMTLLIYDTTRGVLSVGTHWMLCGGIALYLLTIAFIRRASRHAGILLIRVGVVFIVLGVAIWGGLLAPLLVEGLLLVALIGQVSCEVVGEVYSTPKDLART